MFENIQENGVVVLNIDCEDNALEYLEKNLPAQIKKDIARKHCKLYAINANKVATAVGLAGRTNNILILFYFKFGMKGLINFEDAVEDMKQAAKKTYANITAINQSVELIDKCCVEYDEKKWVSLEVTQGFEKLN